MGCNVSKYMGDSNQGVWSALVCFYMKKSIKEYLELPLVYLSVFSVVFAYSY